MQLPGLTAEASLYRSANQYCPVARSGQGARSDAIIPQQFASCTTNRSCWGVVLMCRDHCTRWNGSSFSSAWYACGACFGIFQEFFEFDW